MSVCGKKFNVAIFSDAVDMTHVRLCVMVVLIELYLFIPLLVTLIVFQGHSNVKQFSLKVFSSYRIKLKLCAIVDFV